MNFNIIGSVRHEATNHWLSINSSSSLHTQRTPEPRCVCGLKIQYTDYQCDSKYHRTLRFLMSRNFVASEPIFIASVPDCKATIAGYNAATTERTDCKYTETELQPTEKQSVIFKRQRTGSGQAFLACPEPVRCQYTLSLRTPAGKYRPDAAAKAKASPRIHNCRT